MNTSAPVDVLSKAASAKSVQERRDQADLANHRERITWLSSPEPKWSCGERVCAHLKNVLLRQSMEFVFRVGGAA